MKPTIGWCAALVAAWASTAAAEMATMRIGTPAAAPAAAPRAKRPTCHVIEAAKPPKLDGKLDEEVWSKAPALKLARTLDGSAAAAQPTEARLCRDGRHLYVAVRAVEPMMAKLQAPRRGHDGPIWSDDSVEIFVGLRGVGYWHYGVNAAGSTYDGRGKEGAWNAGDGFKAAAGRDRSAWILEVAIPLKGMLGGRETPTEWTLNVNRNRQVSGRLQEASWSPTMTGNSHVPERFGRMVFGEPPKETRQAVDKPHLKVVPTASGAGVLVFDLSALPKGAKVHRADLRIFRTAKVDGRFDEVMVDVAVHPLFRDTREGADLKVSGRPLAVRGPWFDRLDATEAVRAWAGGRTNGGFYVKACPFINAAASCLDIAYEGRPADPPKQVTDVKARHRGGQTFITWTETTDPIKRDEIQWGQLKQVLADLDRTGRLRYVVYRHTRPVTAANLHEAEPLAEVKPCSSWNVNGRSIERGIDWNLANKYAHMHGHWNPFARARMDGEWGKDCPIDRLVIADGAEPLARTTGLYVHTADKAGKAWYAVVTRVDGATNTVDISPANTAGPVDEKPGEPEPVLQGTIETPFWPYPETKHHYVRWVGPPYANVPRRYYNWSVAVPDEDIAKAAAPAGAKGLSLELNLHCWARSYWRTPYRIERDSIVVCPHDFPLQTWWYGYHSSHGTLKSFKTGRVQPYTERRVLWFLDWVQKKWPVDTARVIVTSKVHRAGGAGPGGDGSGNSGAYHLAFRHPERFNAVFAGGAAMDYAEAARTSMLALWGKREWDLKTPEGKSVWAVNDLPAVVAAGKPGADLPLSTYNGKKVPPATSRLIAACLARGGGVITDYGQWGSGHLLPVSATGTWGGLMIRMNVRKDRLLPTFSRSSADAFAGGPPKYPRLNLGFRFDGDTVVDEPGRIEVAVWREGRHAKPAADVTLTRVQKFKVVPGRAYAWRIGDAEGEAVAGDDGLITIRACPIPSAPTKLVVTPK